MSHVFFHIIPCMILTQTTWCFISGQAGLINAGPQSHQPKPIYKGLIIGCAYVHTQSHTHTHIYIYMYICSYVCIFLYVSIYIYIYTLRVNPLNNNGG